MHKTGIDKNTVYEKNAKKPEKSAKVPKAKKCKNANKAKTCAKVQKSKRAKVQKITRSAQKTRQTDSIIRTKDQSPGTHQSRQCRPELSHIEVGPLGGGGGVAE